MAFGPPLPFIGQCNLLFPRPGVAFQGREKQAAGYGSHFRAASLRTMLVNSIRAGGRTPTQACESHRASFGVSSGMPLVKGSRKGVVCDNVMMLIPEGRRVKGKNEKRGRDRMGQRIGGSGT